MKWLIVSDTHGQTEELEVLKKRYTGEVEAFIHCGDSELSADSPEIAGYLTVEGNCDRLDEYPDQLLRQIGPLKFLITHGHLFDVGISQKPLFQRGRELGAQIICHGHTHFAGAVMHDGILLINPGSLHLPRNYKEGTYVLLEKNEQTLIVRYYNFAGHLVKKFSNEFSIK
ncbi:MAG: metallophosphoesterase [Sporolactobacillus sp.]